MKDSILQIAANMAEKVLEILDNSDLTALVQNPQPLVAVSNYCALDILQAAIEQADAALVEAKAQRKNDGVTICERNTPHCVTTCLGDLCGSCTEPLVSHILSGRLSRNPLAWSADGLRQITMLRTYTKNGGVVTSNDVRVSRSRIEQAVDRKALSEMGYARYRHYAKKQIEGFLHQKRDWSCLNPRRRPLARSTGAIFS